MKSSFALALGRVMGVLAIFLIGLVVYESWSRIQTLEEQVARDKMKLDAVESEKDALLTLLISGRITNGLETLIAAEDIEERYAVVDELLSLFVGAHVPETARLRIHEWLVKIASENDAERRALLVAEFREIRCTGCPTVAPTLSEIPEYTIRDIEILVAIAGAALSGVLSLLAFLRGGGRRELEIEMLSLNVELKRVELAKARHAAREALE